MVKKMHISGERRFHLLAEEPLEWQRIKERGFAMITRTSWCRNVTTPQIGIIGAGNMGRIHARVLNNARALAGVADTDFQKAKQVSETYGAPAFSDFEAMLEEVALDGVIISTPTFTHAIIAEKIADKYDSIRGILIEKPLASNLRDAERVARILNRKKIGAVVSHSEIYNPVVERALDLIMSGNIGKPRTVVHDRRGFVQPSRIPSLGDVFEDIGVHDFDIMSRMSSGSARLFAQGCIQEGTYNSGTVLIKFDDGAEHVFHLSRQYVGRKRTMDVSGTKGTLVLDLFGQIIKVQDLDQEPLADSRTIRLPQRGATIKVYGEPVQEVINDFLKCIETGAKPRVGLNDGIAALRIVEAARKSAKFGKVVKIDVQPRSETSPTR
ncbi:Gfo/Idh/MocA family oxidoreductase [Candidatus Thorarchaeota archaeon]|nr:MAG: Gfo/Idh/MocA family oxidoreductase [Candidatus Thorarchaeota archaeon]